MRNFMFLLMASLLLLSCKENNTDHTNTNDVAPAITEPVKENSYVVKPVLSSTEFPDAQLENMVFKNGKFNFDVISDTYKLGEQTDDADTKMCANSSKGQHIHLIVDNKPYSAQYKSSFDYEIDNGEHYIMAFLSRSYHESIKTDAAHIFKKATVQGNTITAMADVNDPMVIYSRPKGTYVGRDTEKVMLDFYLANTELSSAGNKVIANINGEDYTIDQWRPYTIENLPMGENTVRLSLVDSNGKLINAPLNPVTRTFTLKANPAPEK